MKALLSSLDKIFGPAQGLRAQLVRSTVGSLLIKGGYVLLQFTAGVVLARALRPEGLGVYAYALAMVNLLVIPAQFGFAGYLVRMAAIYRADEKWGMLKGLLSRSSQVVLLVSLVIASLAFILIDFAELVPADMSSQPLLLALVLLPFLALLEVNSGALRGLGHVVIGQLPSQILRPALFLFTLAVMAVVLPSFSPEHAIGANVVATSIALGAGLLLLSRHIPQASRNTRVETASTEWLRGSLPFMLLAGTQVINHQTDVLMLGILTAPDQVGLYRVAVQIADGMGLVLLAITAVITPHLASLHASGNRRTLQRLLVNSHRAGVSMLLPIALLLITFGARFLAVVFGHDYTEAANALTILALGKAVFATVGFSGVALSMFGRAWAATVVTGLTAILNVILNLILIPFMGIEGAALATAVSGFVVALGCIAWMRRIYGYDFSFLGREKRLG